MTPEEKNRISQVVEQIQMETDGPKLLALMEELNELLAKHESQTAIMRAGKSNCA